LNEHERDGGDAVAGSTMMLQVTERAAVKVKELMARERKDGYGLRVAVQGGGCSGFQYGLSYENEQRDTDEVLEFHGLRVFVDAMSLLYLDDVSIDYVDSLQGAGFKIENPRATGSCGCGSSFSM
jgi:iron-sulfur cluster assembly accessory protein